MILNEIVLTILWKLYEKKLVINTYFGGHLGEILILHKIC